MKFGYFLSSEEHGPHELVEQARMAEAAGFQALWISDHFHPWNDQQGQSPFVWGVIGALSEQVHLPVTTAVTCPTVRTHPAVVAHAAATAAVQLDGRFILGVGSGEALNEQVVGGPWPLTSTRHHMLEEAVQIIRRLWTGEVVTHHGEHYTVEHARIYTRPQSPPPIYVSGLAPLGAALAGRIGDGFVCTKPDAALVQKFRDSGGAGKPTQAGLKVCWDPDRTAARDTAHRLWATSGLPGELSQVLRTPEHFMQASKLVTPESTGESVPLGDDVEEYVSAIRSYAEAGYDELYIAQMGSNQKGFFDFYTGRLRPALEAEGLTG